MTTLPTLNELFGLNGKVALVTGGALGIGRSTALRLAEAGAAVVVSDINEAAALETVALVKQAGGKAAAIVTDVAKVADAERAAQFTVETFGRLDILVNNAGVFPPAPVVDVTEAFWDRVMDINLKGAFFMAQAAAKRMIAGGQGGKIVNVASVDALFPTGNLVAYDSSKGGLAMMTKSLAKELGAHGILVNTLAPGGVATPGVKEGALEILGAGADVDLTKFPVRGVLGRMADPDEMARVILFLATDLSAYVTGSMVVADAGMLIM